MASLPTESRDKAEEKTMNAWRVRELLPHLADGSTTSCPARN